MNKDRRKVIYIDVVTSTVRVNPCFHRNFLLIDGHSKCEFLSMFYWMAQSHKPKRKHFDWNIKGCRDDSEKKNRNKGTWAVCKVKMRACMKNKVQYEANLRQRIMASNNKMHKWNDVGRLIYSAPMAYCSTNNSSTVRLTPDVFCYT